MSFYEHSTAVKNYVKMKESWCLNTHNMSECIFSRVNVHNASQIFYEIPFMNLEIG